MALAFSALAIASLGLRVAKKILRKKSVVVSFISGIPQPYKLLGEGAIWDSERQLLLWIDIVRGKLFVFDPSSKTNEEFDLRQSIGTVVPRAGHPNQAVIALTRGIAIYDMSARRVVKWLGQPIEEQECFGNRFVTHASHCSNRTPSHAQTVLHDSSGGTTANVIQQGDFGSGTHAFILGSVADLFTHSAYTVLQDNGHALWRR